jgi:catechol 2,3-dioxygenase-like lactoylglutathione lyase family enzyme
VAGRPIDHVVVAVDDLDQMATQFAGLGFEVTDRSDHPFGTSNRLIVLEDCYIELVAITNPTLIPDRGFARFVADGLAAGRTGPMMVALRTDDPAREVERLRSGGLPTSESSQFGRWVALVDGSVHYAEFATVFVDLGSQVLTGFFCQHLTPELVWRPEVMAHPNGATRLLDLTLPDPGGPAWDRLALLASAEPAPALTLGSVDVSTGGRPSIAVAAEAGHQADLSGMGVTLKGPPR